MIAMSLKIPFALVAVLLVLSSVEVTGNCRDSNSQCAGWASQGECRNNPAYMLVYCYRSCYNCNGRTRVSCQDMNDYCSYWARTGYCRSSAYRTYMASNCRRSCNKCSDSPPSTSCNDYHRFCASWGSSGECARNPTYMRQYCPKSCGICSTN